MTVVKNDNWGHHSTAAVNSLKFFHLGKALGAKGITLPSKMIHDVSDLLANGIPVLDLSRAPPRELSFSVSFPFFNK